MVFTLAHPDKVDRLVLVDSAGYSPARVSGPKPTRESLSVLIAPTLAATKRLMQIIFYHQEIITDDFVRRAFTSKLQKNDGYTVDQFIDSVLRGEDVIDGKLGGIHVPTLIVWGREDRLVPLPVAKALGQDITGSRTLLLEGCGHVPQIECAGPFDDGVLQFLGPAK